MAENVSNGADTLQLGDLTVKRLGFGAMRLCGPDVWGEPEDPEAAEAVLRRVVEVGINFIDTADSYGPGVNERQISSALYPYPDDLVIATKGGLVRPSPGQFRTNGRPQYLREACEGSLRRLKVDTIDVYQLHRPDTRVPFEDSVWALAELREEGKIRHVGLSNVGVRELVMALDIVPIVSVQNRYNLADRSSEAVIETCEREGIAFIPWFPLATGKLARPGGALDEIASATTPPPRTSRSPGSWRNPP
jgi:pyridoxine 4-dehydrogenase